MFSALLVRSNFIPGWRHNLSLPNVQLIPPPPPSPNQCQREIRLGSHTVSSTLAFVMTSDAHLTWLANSQVFSYSSPFFMTRMYDEDASPEIGSGGYFDDSTNTGEEDTVVDSAISANLVIGEDGRSCGDCVWCTVQPVFQLLA